MHIFLFGGTSEGRRIAETILHINQLHPQSEDAGGGAFLTVQRYLFTEIYVATDYGARLLPQGPGLRVHVGRLTEEEMQQRFRAAAEESRKIVGAGDQTDAGGNTEAEEISSRKEDAALPVLVIDATHPYALLVSENIRRACAAARVHCLRVQREDDTAAYASSDDISAKNRPALAERNAGCAMHWVPSIAAAAEWLKNWKPETLPSEQAAYTEAGVDPDDETEHAAGLPNILITTGSKELRPYTELPDYAARCYVRALPTVEALEVCRALGFRQDHLMLMQGPFSEEMNRAQLRHARAGVLVTKDSGETGGFPEKCEAAAALHAALLVIGRPKEVSIPDAPWYHVANLEEVLRLLQADRTSVPVQEAGG